MLVSAPFKREGWYPEVLAGMQMGPEAAESITQSPLYDLYPHADWRVLITKLSDLLRRDYDWSKDVEGLKPQTMLVYADADAVRMAHVVEFFGLLGAAKETPALTVREDPRAGSPSYRVRRITTSAPPPSWQPWSSRSSTRPCWRTKGPTHKKTIDHVEVIVPDRYEATEWYEGALGMKVYCEDGARAVRPDHPP